LKITGLAIREIMEKEIQALEICIIDSFVFVNNKERIGELLID
jgi:hypothetical protein